MKKLIFICISLLFISCAKEGIPVQPNDSKDDFNIEYLFECDGTKIYCFYDNGEARYFATGNGRMTDSRYYSNKDTIENTVIQ